MKVSYLDKGGSGGILPPIDRENEGMILGVVGGDSAWSTLQSVGPAQPVNISPANGEIDVYQYPEFMGSQYYHPGNIPMDRIRFKIATDAALENVVYEGLITTSRVTFTVPEFNALVKPLTSYYWTIRYIDVNGATSEWSLVTGFTTITPFEPTVVLTPEILVPVEDARISPINPVIVSSPFRVAGIADTHKSSDWQLANTPEFESANMIFESLDDEQNLTLISAPITLAGTDFYARVRHKGALTAVKSPWSPRRHFSLREYYDEPLIGIRILGDDTYNLIDYIDGNGSSVRLTSGYFDRHPIYSAIQQQAINDQHVHYCPEFYVRCDSGVDGTKHRFWISPQPFDGAALHPAFGSSEGGLFWGSYLTGHPTALYTTVANSLPDLVISRLNGNPPNPLPYAEWLNTNTSDASRGWHIESIYDHSAMFLLMLIEAKTFNLSSVFGSPGSGTTSEGNNTWRGINNPYYDFSYTNSDGHLYTGYRADWATDYQIGFPNSPSTYLNLGLGPVEKEGTITADNFVAITQIHTGYHETLGTNLEYLFLPKKVSREAGAISSPPMSATMLYTTGIQGTRFNSGYVSRGSAFVGNTVMGSGSYCFMRIAKWQGV